MSSIIFVVHVAVFYPPDRIVQQYVDHIVQNFDELTTGFIGETVKKERLLGKMLMNHWPF